MSFVGIFDRLLPYRWDYPIRTKLFSLIGVLIALISAFIYLYFPARQEKQAFKHLEEQAAGVCEMAAYSVSTALVFRDLEAAQEVFKGAGLNPDLVFMEVIDSSGRIFARYNSDGLGETGVDAFQTESPDQLHLARAAIHHNGHEIGELRGGFSLVRLQRDVDEIRHTVALLSLLVFLIAIVVAFAVSTVVTSPLSRMVEVTRAINRGDMSRRTPVFSNDEIGNLAIAFNEMVGSIEQRTRDLEAEVHERARAKEALRLSEAANRALLDAVPDLMFRINEAGVYLDVKAPQESLLFLPTDEIIGKPISELLPSHLAKPAMESIRRALEFNRLETLEYEIELDGQVRYFEARIVPVAENEVFAISRDISDRKSAQLARIEAERALEEQRTLTMRSDRLRSLGEMAAGIAHELNQPLLGVRGLAEHSLIAMDRDWNVTEEKMRQRLTQIVDQSDRMSHIIEQVRMFAREAGGEDVSSVDVNDVVRAATDLLGAQFSSHGVELKLELSLDLPSVEANLFSLEEVLINLVNNARYAVEEQAASTQADPRVLVRTALAEKNGTRQVEIEVVDNGTGIDPAILEKVFDPSFTTKDPDKGTGLGLAISKSIVEQFHGELNISSTLGQGTTTTILLPANGHPV